MADNAEKTESNEAKKGGKLKLLVGAVVLLSAGAGGVYGAMAAGLIGSAAEPSEPQGPVLVLKGEEDPYAIASGDKKEPGGEAVHGEGGSKYRTAYYSFEKGFTSNFADSGGLIQVDLAASTTRDGRVLQWIDRHELAVRSAILVELAATPEDDAYSIEGKERIQARLVEAINEVLIEKEGFGGIDQVYFEAFLVQ